MAGIDQRDDFGQRHGDHIGSGSRQSVAALLPCALRVLISEGAEELNSEAGKARRRPLFLSWRLGCSNCVPEEINSQGGKARRRERRDDSLFLPWRLAVFAVQIGSLRK